MEMNSFSINLRFFVSVPMVSSDGEPHKLLTMVAVFSGFIVAVIVLLIVIGLIDCRKRFVNILKTPNI